MYEAKKSGLATKLNIDTPNALSAEEDAEIDEFMYARAWITRQKIFQMVLLFDEIIIPGIDPLNDYSRLEETGFFRSPVLMIILTMHQRMNYTMSV